MAEMNLAFGEGHFDRRELRSPAPSQMRTFGAEGGILSFADSFLPGGLFS